MEYQEIVDGFIGIPTGNICDSNNLVGSLGPEIQGLDRHFAVVGRAVTVQCHPGDNTTIHRAICEAAPGSVLVISCRGYMKAGCFGEMFAISCQKRGIRGVVIDGACRDRNEMIERNFPVFAKGVCPNGTRKLILGTINQPILCGDRMVYPDDVIVGDGDGVVVIAKEKAGNVLQKAKTKLKFETEILGPALAEGKTTVELLDLWKSVYPELEKEK